MNSIQGTLREIKHSKKTLQTDKKNYQKQPDKFNDNFNLVMVIKAEKI